jgi:hypothetical protein
MRRMTARTCDSMRGLPGRRRATAPASTEPFAMPTGDRSPAAQVPGPPSTEATTRCKHSQSRRSHTAGSVDPYGASTLSWWRRPRFSKRRSRGVDRADRSAETVASGVNWSERSHAPPVVWSAAARTSTISRPEAILAKDSPKPAPIAGPGGGARMRAQHWPTIRVTWRVSRCAIQAARNFDLSAVSQV